MKQKFYYSVKRLVRGYGSCFEVKVSALKTGRNSEIAAKRTLIYNTIQGVIS